MHSVINPHKDGTLTLHHYFGDYPVSEGKVKKSIFNMVSLPADEKDGVASRAGEKEGSSEKKNADFPPIPPTRTPSNR